MDIEQLKSELKRYEQQVYNLENILKTIEPIVTIPDNEFLTELYNNLGMFEKEHRCDFLKHISNNMINMNNKQFNTIKNEQREYLVVKIKEKCQDLREKIKNIEASDN
jgi:hypothetical protein